MPLKHALSAALANYCEIWRSAMNGQRAEKKSRTLLLFPTLV
jgi:hypothetical protein